MIHLTTTTKKCGFKIDKIFEIDRFMYCLMYSFDQDKNMDEIFQKNLRWASSSPLSPSLLLLEEAFLIYKQGVPFSNFKFLDLRWSFDFGCQNSYDHIKVFISLRKVGSQYQLDKNQLWNLFYFVLLYFSMRIYYTLGCREKAKKKCQKDQSGQSVGFSTQIFGITLVSRTIDFEATKYLKKKRDILLKQRLKGENPRLQMCRTSFSKSEIQIWMPGLTVP